MSVALTCSNPECRKPFERPRWWARRVLMPACSRPCRDVVNRIRTDHYKPKNGRILSHGYARRWVGHHHHLADMRGYALETALVAEEVLGRRLRGDERVKRIGFLKHDNRPEMLVIISPAGTWPLLDLAEQERNSLAGMVAASR